MRLLSCVLLITGLLSCSAGPSVEPLADTYVDLLRFRDRVAGADTATIRHGIDSVVAAHGFTIDTYQATFNDLAGDPDRLSAFFARVDQRLAATNPALQPGPS